MQLYVNNADLKGRYVFYWRGGPGPQRGGIICKHFTNCGGSNLFYMQRGKGHSFLARKKITPCRLVDSYSVANTRCVQKLKTCIYERSYQSKFIKVILYRCQNMMSKYYLVPANIVVSTCAHFHPYFDGGNVCACGSGIRSISSDHYLSYLRTLSTT